MDMSSMFEGAIVFNQNITTWDVNPVLSMSKTFKNAVAFDQLIQEWKPNVDISVVPLLPGPDFFEMFTGATKLFEIYGFPPNIGFDPSGTPKLRFFYPPVPEPPEPPLPEGSCRVYKVPACKFREKTLRNPCPICKIRGKNPTSGICRHVNL